MAERQDGATLAEMTAEIVVAYVSHNVVATSDIPGLITQVGQKLATLVSEEQTPPPPEPAVPVRRSVGKDYIVCLEDGKKLKMLKRYLKTHYDMTPDEYRKRWGLPDNYPMVAPSYAEMRSEMARRMGLGGKAPARRRRSTKRPS